MFHFSPRYSLFSSRSQLGILFFGEQTGHIFIGLVEGPHGVLVELTALFGEDQLLEAGVLLHAPAGDVALRSMSCRMLVTVERVMENSRSMSRWNTGVSECR